ncbi:MinD/ParA family protein [Clostridium botulinum]|uniref:MinD/ParA family protein n=1 Tax=Clostridium botulinum TaxID=1491 RepID=UPI0013F057C8|nr:MinD/ParA family protein [Clostridium botulinum]MBN1070300.1 MinD/ParA family protein [Clostridium botulinum]NFN79532.1 MinD/ParA family protein [Clostridium botulinum]NFT91287.1 MinD/ParA family protein [Clostridium botulinum]
MLDQAEALRKLVDKSEKTNIKSNAKIITVTSGKGGVGKSNFVVNLGIALQNKGKKVLIFDADLGMGNDDVLMGIYPKYNIFDIIFTEKKIEDIIVLGPNGVSLLPAGSGLNKVDELQENQRNLFLEKLESLNEFDYILMDTGAGINKSILSFMAVSEDLIIITTPEPTSLTDAYSLIKAADYFKIKNHAMVVVNRAINSSEGLEVYNKLERAVNKFLKLNLEYLGYVIDDRKVVQSVKMQKPFVISYPTCEASQSVNNIALKILGQDVKTSSGPRELFKKLFKIFS